MQSDLIACPADAASPEDDATILEDEGGAMDDAYEEAKEGEEEAAAGTDDEGDKRQFGIYQCLPVDDREPDWEREEPESVEEYLRRVRYEARHLPAIVSSDIDPRQFDDHRTEHYGHVDSGTGLAECPPEHKPSERWLRHFLGHFAALRSRLQREYELTTGQVAGLPLRVAYAPALDAATRQEMEAMSLDPPSRLMPELAQLAGLDQVAVVGRVQGAIRAAVAAETLSEHSAAGLYALSARLERPLHADVAAAYRALLRRCSVLRAGVKDPRHPLLPHLNILIAVAGAYFGQDEELAALWNDDDEEEAAG